MRFLLILLFPVLLLAQFGGYSHWNGFISDQPMLYKKGLALAINPNEKTGTTSVLDISGNNNNGIAKNGLESNTHPSNAFKFDGVDDHIYFGDILDIGASDFILFAWVKGSTQLGRIISKQNPDGGNNLYYLRRESDGRFRQGLGDGSVFKTWYSSTYYSDDWHFVCAVFDRDGLGILYVDGVADATTLDISALAASDIQGDKELAIGAFAETALYELFADYIGIAGIYLFDGINGRQSELPTNYKVLIIDYNYNNTKKYYQ